MRCCIHCVAKSLKRALISKAAMVRSTSPCAVQSLCSAVGKVCPGLGAMVADTPDWGGKGCQSYGSLLAYALAGHPGPSYDARKDQQAELQEVVRWGLRICQKVGL